MKQYPCESVEKATLKGPGVRSWRVFLPPLAEKRERERKKPSLRVGKRRGVNLIASAFVSIWLEPGITQ